MLYLSVRSGGHGVFPMKELTQKTLKNLKIFLRLLKIAYLNNIEYLFSKRMKQLCFIPELIR